MKNYQAFAWDLFPGGGVKGVAKSFETREQADDWLKFQPQPYRMAVPLSQSGKMFDLIQEKTSGDW